MVCYFILIGYVNAQDSAVPIDSLDFTGVGFLPGEILPEMAKLSDRIHEINEIIKDNDDLSNASKVVNKYDSILKVEKNEIIQNLDMMTYRRMEIRIRSWKNYKDKFEGLKERMREHTNEIESIKNELNVEDERWKAIDVLLKEERFHSEMQQSLDNLINDLNATKKTVVEISKKLYILQQKQSQLIVLIDDMIGLMEQQQQISSLTYFTLDSEPIWYAFDSKSERQSLGSYFTKEISENVSILATYLKSNRGIVIIQLIFIILLISGFIFLGRIWPTSVLDPDSQRETQAGLIIRRPFFSSLLISLIFSLFFYSNRPLVLVEFFILLMLISTVLLLPGLLTNKLKIPLYVLLLLFFVNLFRDFLPFQSFANRLIIFVQGVAILYVFFITYKIRNEFRFRNRSERVFKRIIKTFGALMVIALIANIIGSIKLANFLISSTNRTLIFTAVIVTIVIILNSMMILLIKGKHAQSIPMYEQLKKLIDTRIRPIINWSAFILWFVATLIYFMLYKPFLALINSLMELGLSVGSFSISIGDIFSFALIVFFTFILVRFIKNLFKDEWVNKSSLPRGSADAISMGIRYIIVVIGVYLSLVSLGIDMNKFGFIAGALGVGIGFGLQNIVLNLISGLILAVERPFHIGDVIEIDNDMGRVTDIGVRASKIKTWDGSELIVPNGMLISNKVNNWTLSDDKRRLVIPISTSFDAEPDKVIAILTKVADEHPETLEQPPPMAIFNGYGSSSFDFTMYCWVEFSASLKTKSELALGAHSALLKEGISVPVQLRRLQYDKDKKPL